jgi:hypothetical protein
MVTELLDAQQNSDFKIIAWLIRFYSSKTQREQKRTLMIEGKERRA